MGLWAQPSTALPIVQDQAWGLIDTSGQMLIPPQYDKISEFRKGFAWVQQRGKVGVVDTCGRFHLQPQYDGISFFDRWQDTAFFVVEKGKTWQVMATGDQVVVPDFKGEIRLYEQGFVGQFSTQKSSLWRMPKQQIVSEGFVNLEPLHRPYFRIQHENGQSICLDNGQPFIPLQYRRIEPIPHPYHYWRAMPDSTWLLLDSTGQRQILGPSWASIRVFHPQFAVVRAEGARDFQFAYLPTGHTPDFYADDFKPYRGDTLLYKRHGLWGLVDKAGQRITEPIFEEIRPFADSLLRFTKGAFVGIVSEDGRIVQEAKYDSISPMQGDIALVYGYVQNGFQRRYYRHVINRQGKIIIKYLKGDIYLNEDNVVQQQHNNLLYFYRFSDKGQRYEKEVYGGKATLRIGSKTRGRPEPRSRLLTRSRTVAEQDFPFQWIRNTDPEKGPLRRWGMIKKDSLDEEGNPLFALSPVFLNIHRPRYAQRITFVQHQIRIPGTTDDTRMVWGVFSNEVGKPITRFNIEEVMFQDYRDHPVARCIFEGNTWGLIDSIGRIVAKGYNYIAPFGESKYTVACKKGRSAGFAFEGATSPYHPNFLLPQEEQSVEDFFEKSGWKNFPKTRWGYLNLEGQPLFTFDLEMAYPLIDGTAPARLNGKWGLIDTLGLWVVEPQFDDAAFVPQSERKLLLFQENQSGVGILNQRGQVAVPTDYSRILPQSEGFFGVEKDWKWGFVDTLGQIRIPIEYERVRSFSEGLAAARKEGKWGFIDTTGRWRIPPLYNSVGDFQEGHTWVFNREGRCYIDSNHQKVLTGDFLKTSEVCKGRVFVREREGYRLLLLDGTELFKSRNIRLEAFIGSYFVAARLPNGKRRLLDLNGEWISSQRFRQISNFQESHSLLIHQHKRFLLDTAGQLVRVPQATIKGMADNRIPYRDRAWVEDQERMLNVWGYLDLNGEVAIAPRYQVAKPFQDDLAIVYENFLFHLIDTNGQKVLSLPHKHRLLDQRRQRLLIKAEGQYHFSGLHLLPLVEERFNEADPFVQGVARVRLGRHWTFLHENGLLLCSPKFHEVAEWEKGFAELRMRYRQALVNRKGKIMVPPITDYVAYLGNNLLRIEAGNQVGYLRTDGSWLWPLQE